MKHTQQLDYEKIKGFSKLNPTEQESFKNLHQRHMNALERDHISWTPVKVIKRVNRFEVHFINGDWLHYWADGTRS